MFVSRGTTLSSRLSTAFGRSAMRGAGWLQQPRVSKSGGRNVYKQLAGLVGRSETALVGSGALALPLRRLRRRGVGEACSLRSSACSLLPCWNYPTGFGLLSAGRHTAHSRHRLCVSCASENGGNSSSGTREGTSSSGSSSASTSSSSSNSSSSEPPAERRPKGPQTGERSTLAGRGCSAVQPQCFY